jgi:hypothetical protein
MEDMLSSILICEDNPKLSLALFNLVIFNVVINSLQYTSKLVAKFKRVSTRDYKLKIYLPNFLRYILLCWARAALILSIAILILSIATNLFKFSLILSSP